MQEKTLPNQANSTSNIHSMDFGSVSYDIFGSPYQKTGSFLADDSLDFGYLGKPYNADTELYDYGFRDYSPEIARFTSVDPIRDGRNWYCYVVNDPVNFVDLWGLNNYILYDEQSFSKQAEAEKRRIPTTNDEETYMIPIKTEEEFLTAWNNMENITDVTLIFHGSVTTININWETKDYLTTNPNGLTPKGNEALYIGDLETKKIETLKIYSCQGGNLLEEINVAKIFAENNEIENLYASDGPLGFTPITYKPRLSFEGRKEYYEKYQKKPEGLVKIDQRRCVND